MTVNDKKRGLLETISAWLHKLAKLLGAEMRAQLSGIRRISATDTGSTAIGALADKVSPKAVPEPAAETKTPEDEVHPETVSGPAAETKAPEDEVHPETVSVSAAETRALPDEVSPETVSEPVAETRALQDEVNVETGSEPAAEIREPVLGPESKAGETDQAWLMRTLGL